MSNQYKVLAISQWLEKSEYANDVPNQNLIRATVKEMFDDVCSKEFIEKAAVTVANKLRRKPPTQTDAEVAEIIRQFFVDNSLLSSEKRNIGIIGAYIDKNFQGFISRAALDNALYILKDQLSFRQPAAPPPPAPVAVPVIEDTRDPNLEDWQLDIDADEWTVRNADVKAVRDLVRRREVRDRAAASQDPNRVTGKF